MASSVDVGWHDGKPRIVSEDVCDFVLAGGKRGASAAQTQPATTRIPRPRSGKNVPKPALLVDYGRVLRNEVDAFTLKGASGVEKQLALSNAETAKQFEFLSHAGISTANHHASTAEMRQSASVQGVDAEKDHARGCVPAATATSADASAAARGTGKVRKAAKTRSAASGIMSKMRCR